MLKRSPESGPVKIRVREILVYRTGTLFSRRIAVTLRSPSDKPAPHCTRRHPKNVITQMEYSTQMVQSIAVKGRVMGHAVGYPRYTFFLFFFFPFFVV